MDFETFRENLARDIKETLEARSGSDFEVEHRTAEKMNGNYEAIVVKPADSEVGVSLNASTLYKDYESGVSYETIAKGATDLADRSLRNQPEFDVDSFKDYDKMKGTLAMEVVSKERNAELLDTVPHKDIEDMSVVYRFVLGETPAGSGTILVTNQMLENYGITADQLHTDAMKTAPEVRPLVIEGMGQVLAKQMGVEDLEVLGLNIPPEQEQMFVASVEGNVYGAGVLAYSDFFDKVADRLGDQQECLGLTWDDLDFEKRIISVNHSLSDRPDEEGDCRKRIETTTKTAAGMRTIPMVQEVFDAFLMEYEFQKIIGFCEEEVDGYSGFVFSTGSRTVQMAGAVNRALHSIIDDANKLEERLAKQEKREPIMIPQISAHNLRHTFCTRLCENEQDFLRGIRDT